MLEFRDGGAAATAFDAAQGPRAVTAIALQCGFLGATWFRRGLQSRTGHTEGWLPRKYTQKSITANDNSYALAA